MKLVIGKGTLIAALIAGAVACEGDLPARKGAPTATPRPSPEARPPDAPATPMVVRLPPPTVVGMEDPFKLMTREAARALDGAWRAARAGQHAEARAGFAAVVAAYPDKTAARFAEVRMAIRQGDFAAVPALWKELLARDYLGYAHRLDTGKETAKLRRSPEWARLQAITAEMKQAHLEAMKRGVFFVARVRGAGRPEFSPDLDGAGSLARLAPDQEAYLYDPGSARVQRLSDTGGKVVAIHADGKRRQLMMLTAGKLKKTDGRLSFTDLATIVLSLETLEPIGPLPVKGDASSVDLCFVETGEPLWVLSSRRPGAEVAAVTLDATRTRLVGTQERCTPTVAITSVKPGGVTHARPSPEGVALSDDGLRLTGVDGDAPVRAGSPIRPGTFGWSPGKKRFVYTEGKPVDLCEEVAPADEAASALYVWESGRKRSKKLRSATTELAAEWVDDDRLAIEGGKGLVKKLTIHDLAGDAAPLTLDAPAGAGLHGLPVLDCSEAEHHALAL